jgi:predicted ATPase
MDRVFFEGIRCFYSRQEVPLAPVTLLVGENSSGKSTVLALIRLAWDVLHEEEPDFNEEPFPLGAYDQIASNAEVSLRRPMFTIGWITAAGSVTGTFDSDRGQPQLKMQLEQEGMHRLLPFLQLASRPYAFAPVRTKPLRTYDPIKGAVSPEGDHVPLILATLARSSDWQALAAALESFGRHSGLFTKVEVRQLGGSESDPFQIQVHIGGKPMNLIDVGYGVSQVLPIIVDCLRGKEGGIFLLQQPEVHLHPRAQAELGSFLAVLAKQQNKRFVIETHSDYLVDRIRMDIRDKKGITPEDVALLYFERKNGEATIHRLDLDEQGNILNAPPGYRSFFLEEERRFLGG